MDQRRPDRDREILPEQVATRVLARASELEALRRAGASVADLRAAALEAGISESAFEEALGEIQQAEMPGRIEARRPTRSRFRSIATAVAGLALVVTAFGVIRMISPARPAAVAETFTLRCMPAHEAANMLRPVLVRSGTVSFSMRTPDELRITGSPEQLRQARSLLEERDVPGSTGCQLR